MPRISRNLKDNGYYHILSRGNDKKNIFRCEEDYFSFLAIILKYLAKYLEMHEEKYYLIEKKTTLESLQYTLEEGKILSNKK